MFGSVHMTNKEFISALAGIVARFNNGDRNWKNLNANIDRVLVVIRAPKSDEFISATLEIHSPNIRVHNFKDIMEIWVDGKGIYMNPLMMNNIRKGQIKQMNEEDFSMENEECSVKLGFS